MTKKLFVFTLILLQTLLLSAQRRTSVIKWISAGIKAGYGNSVLLNSDIASDENVSMNYLTPSYFFGGRLTFTYGEVVGVGAEYDISSFGQKYDVKINDIINTKNLSIKSSDLLVFLRLSGASGGYFEIGPKFTTIKSMSVQNSATGNFRNEDNISDFYTPKITSVMLGGGLSVVRTERVSVHVGVRVAYGLGDMRSDANYFILEDHVYQPNYLPSNAKTNPLSIQLVLEAEYFFAFWGNAKCGKGRLMFFQ